MPPPRLLRERTARFAASSGSDAVDNAGDGGARMKQNDELHTPLLSAEEEHEPLPAQNDDAQLFSAPQTTRAW